MPRIPKQIIRDVLMDALAKQIGPEVARTKAITALAAGAQPPWRDDDLLDCIGLTSYLVRQRLREELPEPEKEGARLYVLGFQGLRPVVKVGLTRNPEQRFDTHQTHAQNFGFILVDGWVSAPVETSTKPSHQERDVLTQLHFVLNGWMRGGRIEEWFHGHDFERIRSLVQNRDVMFEQYLAKHPPRG
ncbi:hypothetical protein [Streptomyces sp. NPDC058084]|uniref:hypothetical protein n=1 Tax=Streptomyces sp. NPDC058084 TaxID=3346333 RepID=UPI0036E9204F